MHRVGTAVRNAQGLVIVRAPDTDDVGTDGTEDGKPVDEIGTMVLDDSLETVGRVVDVFGPVDRPYLAVTPDADVHTPTLVGSTLYAR